MVSSFQLKFPAPHPTLTPRDVINIQLDALQNNDLTEDDAGFRAAFAFASPQARNITGSVDAFRDLLHSPLYSTLLGFERAHIDQINYGSNRAQADVRIYTPRGTTARFIFTLSLQGYIRHGRRRRCWLIDGLLPMA